MEIDNVTYEDLQAFINTGKTDMPTKLQKYFEILEIIRSLYSKYNSKKFIINTITSTVYGIQARTADKLYNDALNFFYSDNDVKKEAWCNIYAEKIENAAMVAWEQNDMETYRRLIMDAAELRGCKKPDESKILEPYDRRPVIYVVDAKKMGLPEVNRRDLADFIDSLDINVKDKTRAKRDAMIEDVEFEIFPGDDKTE